jgi:hypothetical protein
MPTSTCFGDYGRKNITREVLARTVSSVQSPPQKTKDNPKWVPATGRRKENFTEFCFIKKLKMDMEAIAYWLTKGTRGGRRKNPMQPISAAA